MSNNIFVNLELPINVEIDFNFFPRSLPTKAARKIEEDEMVSDVICALNFWYYESE